jgi:glycosidase
MHAPQTAQWVPEWARRAVFYHIYPLGFLDAPAENNGRSAAVPRLAGLRRWYDHIAGLGVTALLLGPIFESSTHGYDTIDYFQIDRRLGDLALFKQIIAEPRARYPCHCGCRVPPYRA